MNSDKSASASQRGNAMIYILIGLALLALLTAVLVKQNNDGGDDLSTEQADLQAIQILAYATSAQGVIDQMIDSGSTAATLDFTNPGSANFDVEPTIHKLFHPNGGGLNRKAPDLHVFTYTGGGGGAPPAGWYVGRFNNFEWTPTSADDVILTARGIDQKVCESIDKKITGSATIPSVTADHSALFVGNGQGYAITNIDFTSAMCPSCEGLPSLCVSKSGSQPYTFYSIILAR